MALSSSSTDAQVEAAYDDNSDYREVGGSSGITKAKTFIQAVRILIRRMASEMQKGAERLKYDMTLLRDEMEKAQDWLEGQADTGDSAPTYLKVTNYRD